MESNCTNCNENVYFACRKKAASYNEKLNSRESAAELLGISPSTLANHELGITKSVPVDTVVMMADLYKAPELKNMYCKKECPIPVCQDLRPGDKDSFEINARTLKAIKLSMEEVQLLRKAAGYGVNSKETAEKALRSKRKGRMSDIKRVHAEKTIDIFNRISK